MPQMRDRACNVLGKEAVIETDALGELLNPAVGSHPEHTGPGGSSQGMPF